MAHPHFSVDFASTAHVSGAAGLRFKPARAGVMQAMQGKLP